VSAAKAAPSDPMSLWTADISTLSLPTRMANATARLGVATVGDLLGELLDAGDGHVRLADVIATLPTASGEPSTRVKGMLANQLGARRAGECVVRVDDEAAVAPNLPDLALIETPDKGMPLHWPQRIWKQTSGSTRSPSASAAHLSCLLAPDQAACPGRCSPT